MTKKIPGKLLVTGTTQLGKDGTQVQKILSGIVSACVPVVSASATNSGSMAIADAEVGDKLFFTGSNVSAGVTIYSAVVSAAGGITASYMNPTGTDTSASTLSFSYLLVKS